MTSRQAAPAGAPCWADLWTSDVEASRGFYSELFGWEAQAPSPEFGGYFMFTRDGAPVAGGMGDMGDVRANNTWKIYLSVEDAEKTVLAAESSGAKVLAGTDAVADLGTQAVLLDPAGATVGVWQPGSFPGFTVLSETGAPDWFELWTRDYAQSVDFYRHVFGWNLQTVSDTDEFRYSVFRSGDTELAGIMDASSFLPEGCPSEWSIYWRADVDDTVGRVKALGGSVVMEPQDTPYGRLAIVADPAGAQFKLRQPPK